MLLTDGTGKGTKLKIDDRNRANTSSLIYSLEHLANHVDELAFAVTFRVVSGGVNVALFYIENQSDMDLVVEEFAVSFDQACEGWVTLANEGSLNNESLVVPVNLTSGSGKAAIGIFAQGVDLAGGAATLDAGKEIGRIITRSAIPTTVVNAPQDIVLPKNRTLVGWVDTAGVDVYARVDFNYHEKEV